MGKGDILEEAVNSARYLLSGSDLSCIVFNGWREHLGVPTECFRRPTGLLGTLSP